jgi:hypothetical protein
MGSLLLLVMAKNAINLQVAPHLGDTALFLMKEVRFLIFTQLEGGANIYSSCDNR